MNKQSYILAYGFSGERLETLQDLCSNNAIELKLLGNHDLDTIVQDLLPTEDENLSPIEPPSSYELDLEHILFVNFVQDELMTFLDLLNERQLAVPYKAALTDNNRKWVLRELIDANRKEHQFVKLYRSSKNLLSVAAELLEKTKDPVLLEAMEGLSEVLADLEKQEALSPELEDEMYEKMRASYNDVATRFNTLVSKE